MEIEKVANIVTNQARPYISYCRTNGFQPNELKLYWNYEQIRDIIKNDTSFNSITDTDSRDALLKIPVNERNNTGKIDFLISGIEKAVFKVPKDKQIIVLDFADERMPGGYFIEGANTQEEVILYNSDGYRALLDLKYTMMDGGYALPEYGVAYVKNVRFFLDNRKEEGRLTDLIVAACYDISGASEGLYETPSSTGDNELYKRTLEKFRAIIASAVANTEGTGKNTYLLLGPIGTGAFGNDQKMIAELFSEVLNNSLMDSSKPIRYAFEEIWFVSIGSLEAFEQVFETNASTKTGI